MTGASTPQKTKTGRIFAIIGVLLLLGSIGPMPDYVEEAEAVHGGDSAHLSVTLSDYETEVDEVIGINALAYIVLEDPSLSVDDQRGVARVEISSATSRGHNPDEVARLDLIETGIGTGVFKGGFGFSDDDQSTGDAEEHPLFGLMGLDNEGDPINAHIGGQAVVEVETQDDDGNIVREGEEIRIRPLDSNLGTKTFDWRPADNAADAPGIEIWVDGSEVSGDLEVTDFDQEAIIRIRDDDLHDADSETLSNLVFAWSASDTTRVPIPLTKTSDGPPARFDGELAFKSERDGDSDSLFVQPGNDFFIEFFEPHTDAGEPVHHVIGGLFSADDDGAIFALENSYYGITDDDNKHGSDRATIVISDGGLKTDEGVLNIDTIRAESVDIGIEMWDDDAGDEGDWVEISDLDTLAHQLHPHTGIYIATLNFNVDVVGESSHLELRAVYEDGESDPFEWRELQEAAIWIEDLENGDEISDQIVGEDTYRICVSDTDSLSSDSIKVRAKSTSNPTTGLQRSLSTSDSDQCSPSADFTSTFELVTGSAGTGQLQVQEEDWLVVEYDDPKSDDGSNRIIRSDYLQWFTSAPTDPDTEDAEDAEDEDFTIESIQFVEDDFETAISQVSQGDSVFLRLDFDEDEDLPENDVVFVTLSSPHCSSGDVTLFLFETEGQGYTGPVNFIPGGEVDCGDDLGFNEAPVSQDLGEDVGEGDLHRVDTSEQVVISLDGGAIQTGIAWYPADNARLEVIAESRGNGEFDLEITDRDMLPHIVFADATTADSDQVFYNFTSPYISGTEQVFVERTESSSVSAGNSEDTFDVSDGLIFGPGEGRLPTCSTVSIFFEWETTGTLPGEGGSGSEEPDCVSVTSDTITFDSVDCPAADIGSSVTCTLEVEYLSNADAVAPEEDDDGNEECPGSAGGFDYIRTSLGIRFCSSPPDNMPLEFDYVLGERTVTGIGPNNDETQGTLVFDGFGNSGLPVFKGDIEPWFTTGSSAEDIVFVYEDPVHEFGEGPTSSNPDHFQSIFAQTQWLPSETGQLRFRNLEFTQSGHSTVFGDAIPIEVVDIDASKPDRQDILTIHASTSSANGIDVTLIETGANTGAFRGVIPVGDLSGVTGRTTIDVAYSDSHDSSGEGRDIETDIIWRPSTTGTISVRDADGNPIEIDAEDTDFVFTGTTDPFFIRVDDRDRFFDSDVKVRVSSTSDDVGEEIKLQRVGTSVASHHFISDPIRFETTNNPGNGRLYVEPTDEIHVDYEDPITEDGVRKTINEIDELGEGDVLEWEPRPVRSASIDRQFHIGADPGDFGDPEPMERLARGYATFTDPSLAGEDLSSLTVDIESRGFADDEDNWVSGINEVALEFIETGLNTGVFITMFSFKENAEDACNGDFDCLLVDNRDSLRINYDEGVTSSAAQWFQAGWGVVTFDQRGYFVPSEPTVIVYDADLEDEDGPFEVLVASEADTTGVTVDLSERGTDTGIYTGSFSISTSSGADLLVSDEDVLTAQYEDLQPPGTRQGSATVGVEGLEAPVTNLVTTPSAPDGENGWFVSAPEINFEVSRPSDTFYQLDGDITPFTGPFSLGEGFHELKFWSEDFLGNEEGEQEVELKVSLTDPDEEVNLVNATSQAGGNVQLNWDAISSGKTDPLVFGAYQIFRGPEGAEFEDAEVELAGNATNESFTDTPPSKDPPQRGETFTYYVRVANEAGRLGPVSDSIDGLSDRVAPSLESFDVDADELREEDDEDTVSATLTVTDDSENLADIEEVFLRVIDPFGEEQEEVDMESVDSTTWSVEYDGFEECGVYTLLGIASDAVGNEGRLNHSLRYVAIDAEAPRVVGFSEEVDQGQDVNVTVRDNCAGLESVSYSIDGGDSRDVSIPTREEGEPCEPGPCEVFFQIPADRLSVGENLISFVLTDANETANEAVVTMTVLVVVPPDPEEPPDVTTPPSIGDGSSLVEFGGRFSFTVSGGTPTSLTFEVDGLVNQRSVLNGLDAATGLVRVDVGELEPGPHEAIVRASNPSGNDRQTFDFYVLDSGVPLPPQNVRVEEDENGRPVVTWEASPSEPAKVGGYLVHRASSPWAVIGVTDANTLSFTDLTALGSRNYQYAVTAFGPNGEGSLEPGADSEESLPWFQGVQATTFETSNIDEGVPNWIWWGLLVVLAVLVVVSLVYVNRQAIFGRKPEHLYAQDTVQEQYPDEAAEHSTPFGEEQHMIRCPNCSDEFHVSGERPVVTACPNCGRKGILR